MHVAPIPSLDLSFTPKASWLGGSEARSLTGWDLGLRTSHPLACLILILLSLSVHAAIPVDGVADRQIYVDTVTFQIPGQSGYQYVCLLNGNSISTDTPISCGVDYYDLSIRTEAASTGAISNRLVRFIVRSSERRSSEIGLRPWVPFPLVNSASSEFEGARLELILPSSFPVGLPIPSVARVWDSNDQAVRLNGSLSLDAFQDANIQLRRGIGSLLLPAVIQPGVLGGGASLGPLMVARPITLEAATDWTVVGGVLTGSVSWPPHSRIRVEQSLTLSNDTQLLIGAGAVVVLNQGVNVELSGRARLTIEGTLQHPVVLCPDSPAHAWGGVIVRGSNAVVDIRAAFLTGSGANAKWFTENTGYSVHRREQALLLLDAGAQAYLTNAFLIDNHGQAGHSRNSFITLSRSLIQRCVTAGEYAGGSAKILESALLEFPADDGVFADDDNDAIYFTTGDHLVADSLVGWAGDDALDAGSGGLGSMTVTNCWLESAFHEAMAWSGDNGRKVRVQDTVAMNCGQGIEAGFGKPDVRAHHILSLGNLTGARFGDNYDWTYAGFLQVTNSLLLHNDRNIWGQTWTPNAWTNELDQMDLQGNLLTQQDPLHPLNTVFDPTLHADRLREFLRSPADRPVGAAFLLRSAQVSYSELTNGLPVGLSRFAVHNARLRYRLSDLEGNEWRSGELQFEPGRTVLRLPGFDPATAPSLPIAVSLEALEGAELTGLKRLFYVGFSFPPAGPAAWIPKKSEWRYWEEAREPTNGWKQLSFDDSGWKTGQAQFGFGDGDEQTPVAAGRNAYYFRKSFQVDDPTAYRGLDVSFLRDDGGVVYLNGTDIFRSNIKNGLLRYADQATLSTPDESVYLKTNAPLSLLLTGLNQIAVEVHQVTNTSADASFDLQLHATPVPARPLLHLIRTGGTMLLLWTGAEFSLEVAPSAEGPWSTLPAAKSPWLATPSADRRFYRLRE